VPHHRGEPLEATFRRVQAGEQDAARELLAALLPELESFVRQHIGAVREHESVADLTQSVAGDLLPLVHRESFVDLAGFRAWLRRVARNKIVDRHRYHGADRRDHARRADVSPSVAETLGLTRGAAPLPSPSQVAMSGEDTAQLERALLRLPDDQRQVVTMARMLGMAHRDIALALDRSEVACRMLLRRGMVNLARELDVDADDRHPD